MRSDGTRTSVSPWPAAARSNARSHPRHVLLAAPDFRRLFLADLLVLAGERYATINFAWWLLSDRGDSGLGLGLLMAIESLPTLLLGFLVGPIVDAADKRRCMLLSVGLQACCLGAIAVLLLEQRLSLGVLCALAFAQCCFVPLFEDAVSAALPRVVGDDQLVAASSIQSATLECANVAAAAMSAPLIAAFGATAAAAVNVGLYVAAGLLLLSIRADLRPEGGRATVRAPYRTALREGLHYVARNPPLRAMVAVYSVETLFFAPVFLIVPMFVRTVLRESVAWVGVLEVVGSCGAVLMALAVSWRRRFRYVYPTYAAGLALLGLLMFALRASDDRFLATAVFLGMNLCLALLIALSNALFQETVDDQVKGRFFGLLNSGAAAMAPLSFLGAGVLAARVTVTGVLSVNGVGLLVLSALVLVVPRIATDLESCDRHREGPDPVTALDHPLGGA